jgi:hypothetical protein
MMTGVLIYIGALCVAVFINYCLHANNPNWEEPIIKSKDDSNN